MSSLFPLLRLASIIAATGLLCQCATSPEDEAPLGQPTLEKMEHAQLDPAPDNAATPSPKKSKPNTESAGHADADPPPTGLAPVTGKNGRFLIRDAKGTIRVDGTLKAGRMEGICKYFDPAGRRLAVVGYAADQRQGPITLYYVTADGAAAGKKKLTATYQNGALNGMAKNWFPNSKKQLERDFDNGILQGSRGWQENGQELTDSAAQSLALEISQAEDALLEELEAFVQLKIRENATEAASKP